MRWLLCLLITIIILVVIICGNLLILKVLGINIGNLPSQLLPQKKVDSIVINDKTSSFIEKEVKNKMDSNDIEKNEIEKNEITEEELIGTIKISAEYQESQNGKTIIKENKIYLDLDGDGDLEEYKSCYEAQVFANNIYQKALERRNVADNNIDELEEKIDRLERLISQTTDANKKKDLESDLKDVKSDLTEWKKERDNAVEGVSFGENVVKRAQIKCGVYKTI